MARDSASARGYGTKWQKARAEFLKMNPWCRYCAQIGRHTRATLVDHREPHRRDWKKFWDRNNWVPSCATCHNGMKQQLEKSGTERGCDESGMPLDPNHRWNR